jgi:hypothetical protein
MNPALTFGVSAAAAVLFVKSQTNRPPVPQNIGSACASARMATTTTTVPEAVVADPVEEEIDPYAWQDPLFHFSPEAENSFKGPPNVLNRKKNSQKVTEAMKEVQAELMMDKGNGSKSTGVPIPTVGRTLLDTRSSVPVTGGCMFNMSDGYARALQEQTEPAPEVSNNPLDDLMSPPQ